MLEQLCRASFQQIFVDDVARTLHRCFPYVTPTQYTTFGAIVGVISACFIGAYDRPMACGLLLLSGYVDVLDGTIARISNQCTKLGCAMDIFCDRVVEAAVVCGFYAADPVGRGWYCLCMMGSILLCVTSFLLAAVFPIQEQTKQSNSQAPKKTFHYSGGIIERAEAFGFFLFMIVFPEWFSQLSIIFSCLTMLTTAIRMKEFIQGHSLQGDDKKD